MMMDIDRTGMLYALLRADYSVPDALRDYFTCESVQFNSDCGVELVLSNTELRDRLTNGQMPSGMARLQSGFLYVLSDSSAVLGFDGDKLDRELQQRVLVDERFESTFPWGDQPPPETRAEILRIASEGSR